MKRLFVLFTIVMTFATAAQFVNPLHFGGSSSEKQAVIAYIKENVKETYSKIGMDDPVTLRMMERKNLDAFKRLFRDKDKDPQLLQKMIDTYCAIDMCNYVTIDMMYRKNLEASHKDLHW